MIRLIICVVIIVAITLLLHLLTTDYDKCYSEMEHSGYAVMECCGGITGGTKSTDYLSNICVDCPYLVLGCAGVKKEELDD